ncbi:UPF0193 protein EVG1 [Neodiprion fabricii]|uniref:UPF0193 protein EVG1 n=1 Tax=Neodiprion fabricii TaxID=2872261 RepID=UPI001ED8EC34|nr:UPF0193 protein EVG1 [Neodiprion fabricii]XP_046434567.1 UPF0193 protein EVG1 [Neodiprion fabricii]XP_046434568.1 UPF0193 protein EVG1 [Neodiprion fabricii]XP_046434569.1 UPF0193 protein EVG1 [Neodiprion fabricii]
MEPRTERVAIGVGAIHNPARAQYSEETRNLIKILMEESRLTMMQRKSIQDAVDRGESLPPPSATKTAKTKNEKFAEAQVMFPCVWKKRSQDIITKSGAYEREQFRRTAPLLNKEKQKRHLACIMAYGKDMPPTPHGPKLLHRGRKIMRKIPEDVDPLNDIVKSIEERIEFVHEMESLGQGKKYRPIIQQEIAQKLRLLEKIDKQRSADVKKIVQRFEPDKSSPKPPFPLGELDC